MRKVLRHGMGIKSMTSVFRCSGGCDIVDDGARVDPGCGDDNGYHAHNDNQQLPAATRVSFPE